MNINWNHKQKVSSCQTNIQEQVNCIGEDRIYEKNELKMGLQSNIITEIKIITQNRRIVLALNIYIRERKKRTSI